MARLTHPDPHIRESERNVKGSIFHYKGWWKKDMPLDKKDNMKRTDISLKKKNQTIILGIKLSMNRFNS